MNVGATLTPGRVEAVIAEQFPELAGMDIATLGSGTDHHGFRVGGRYVFRFPAHAGAAAGMQVEARLTAWLAPSLPLAVPRYQFSSDDPTTPFSGYAMLPGTPALHVAAAGIDMRRIGFVVGDFLRHLHASDAAAAAALGVPDDDDPSREAWHQQAVADLRFACSRQLLKPARMTRWSAFLDRRPAPFTGTPTLLHGDIAAEHVLLDRHGAPCGVIDWSDALLGDPAQDLAGLLHWGGTPMLAAASRAWGPIDDDLLHRARWFAACRALADVVHGTTTGDVAYVRAGLGALSALGDALG